MEEEKAVTVAEGQESDDKSSVLSSIPRPVSHTMHQPPSRPAPSAEVRALGKEELDDVDQNSAEEDKGKKEDEDQGIQIEGKIMREEEEPIEAFSKACLKLEQFFQKRTNDIQESFKNIKEKLLSSGDDSVQFEKVKFKAFKSLTEQFSSFESDSFQIFKDMKQTTMAKFETFIESLKPPSIAATAILVEELPPKKLKLADSSEVNEPATMSQEFPEETTNYTDWAPLYDPGNKVPCSPGIFEFKISGTKKAAYIGLAMNLFHEVWQFQMQKPNENAKLRQYVIDNYSQVLIRYEAFKNSGEAVIAVQKRRANFARKHGQIRFQ